MGRAESGGMGDGIDVMQDVAILSVESHGRDLQVDVYGGESNACGSVRFTFTDRAERATQRRLLERWMRDEIALTFVASGTTVTLQNDRAVYGDQLAASGDDQPVA